jgi:hypothetical protein
MLSAVCRHHHCIRAGPRPHPDIGRWKNRRYVRNYRRRALRNDGPENGECWWTRWCLRHDREPHGHRRSLSDVACLLCVMTEGIECRTKTLWHAGVVPRARARVRIAFARRLEDTKNNAYWRRGPSAICSASSCRLTCSRTRKASRSVLVGELLGKGTSSEQLRP